MLIGNQNVINKSCGYFYGAPTTTGSASTGVSFAQGRSTFINPSILHGVALQWPKASFPDGYNALQAFFPSIKSGGLSAFTTISGAGSLEATAILARLSEAVLSGLGTITADLSVVTPGEAALTGVGTLTAEILAVSSLAAVLSGSGGVSANLSAVVPMEAALSGTGTVAGSTNLTGVGRLEAEILPFTELSPQSLAQSLLDANDVETDLTVRNALRIIAASLAGKVSGAETTTITFKNAVADDINRIVATVDGDGNRTAITYDLSD